MASTSSAPDNDGASVIALHAVLFNELGDWKPITEADAANLAEYRQLATEAHAARDFWAGLSKTKHVEVGECETAYNFMLAAEDACLAPLYRILHSQKRSALCFSGGGIRSSTFCLGVLEALAKYSFAGDPAKASPRLVAEFDYLSTVSGGGYVGSWFSSWIAREGETAAVLRQLAQTPSGKLDPEPKPIQHLRDYSNYLNPRLGLLSADTWTLVATTLRNIMLNWLVLIPFVAAALLLPVLYRDFLATPAHDSILLLLSGFLLGVLGTAFVMHNLPSFGNRQQGENRFVIFCLLPLAFSAVFLTTWWGRQPPPAASGFYQAAFALFGGLMHAAGVLGGVYLSKLSDSPNFRKGRFQGKLLAITFVAAVGTGALGGWLIYFVAIRFHPALVNPDAYCCLAVPTVFATLALVGVFSVGAASRFTDDDDREWWSRAGAWVLIASVFWILFSSLVLLLPGWVADITASRKVIFSAVSAALGWYATQAGASGKSAAGTRGDQSAAQSDSGLSARLHQLLVPVSAILFLIALAFGITLLNDWASGLLQPFPHSLVLVELALAVLASCTVSVNKFSLHAMYRMRLIRAFLGASNEERKPNPFTGFDPADNLEMQHMSPAKPMHVLNLCLNLVSGSKLAWQQRKAESFTVTRLHSGSLRVGYQPSGRYGGTTPNDGITLGTAMTISGAAASPNMGYHSSSLAAIVMTLFNARLGWWLANPGEPGRGFWTCNGPAFSIRPFLDEALGRTNDSNRYVYLSDGGHFENLGIYEMVLRRCHFIVVVDAGADPDYTEEDLGNAVRKIRIDMGVPIEFSSEIRINPALGVEAKHCALGWIRYDCVDPGAEPGKLLYIKPVLNGNEPADVLNYQSANKQFPQQPTADQWFDESQFESYRRLGAHSVEEMFRGLPGGGGIEELFAVAEQYLSPPEVKRAAGGQ
ncbi:MAG TPA: hypothetical protein VGL97_14655 [Bryobacteraceae bacterium]